MAGKNHVSLEKFSSEPFAEHKMENLSKWSAHLFVILTDHVNITSIYLSFFGCEDLGILVAEKNSDREERMSLFREKQIDDKWEQSC